MTLPIYRSPVPPSTPKHVRPPVPQPLFHPHRGVGIVEKDPVPNTDITKRLGLVLCTGYLVKDS